MIWYVYHGTEREITPLGILLACGVPCPRSGSGGTQELALSNQIQVISETSFPSDHLRQSL